MLFTCMKAEHNFKAYNYQYTSIDINSLLYSCNKKANWYEMLQLRYFGRAQQIIGNV